MSINVSNKKSVFVIDDDQFIHNQVQAALKDCFMIKSFLGPQGVVKRIQQDSPDFILLDLNMPNVDGVEILNMLNLNPLTSDIPVICMSQDDSFATRQVIESKGSVGFIKKPIELSSFKQNIQEILDGLNTYFSNDIAKRSFIIPYNYLERGKELTRLISNFDEEQVIVIISTNKAKELIPNSKLHLVDKERIIYLKIRPSLISKLPYLEDMTSISEELKQMLPIPTKNMKVIVDTPLNFLNIQQQDRSIAQGMMLFEVLGDIFENIVLINTRTVDETINQFLYKLAKVFIGK